MTIDSPRFGSLTIEPSRIIEFPVGLAGFEQCKRFTLFHPDDENPRYFILQSLDDPSVAFNIADPGLFGFNYDIQLSDDDMALIGMTDPAQVVVVVILAKDADGAPVRANLKAPLVINLESRRGLQHIFSHLNYDVAEKGA